MPSLAGCSANVTLVKPGHFQKMINLKNLPKYEFSISIIVNKNRERYSALTLLYYINFRCELSELGANNRVRSAKGTTFHNSWIQPFKFLSHRALI